MEHTHTHTQEFLSSGTKEKFYHQEITSSSSDDAIHGCEPKRSKLALLSGWMGWHIFIDIGGSKAVGKHLWTPRALELTHSEGP